jgi:hypothetical protein
MKTEGLRRESICQNKSFSPECSWSRRNRKSIGFPRQLYSTESTGSTHWVMRLSTNNKGWKDVWVLLYLSEYLIWACRSVSARPSPRKSTRPRGTRPNEVEGKLVIYLVYGLEQDLVWLGLMGCTCIHVHMSYEKGTIVATIVVVYACVCVCVCGLGGSCHQSGYPLGSEQSVQLFLCTVTHAQPRQEH